LLVKVCIDGEDTAGRDALAKALERDVNNYLIVTASEPP